MGFFDIFKVNKIKEELELANQKLNKIGFSEYEQTVEFIQSQQQNIQKNKEVINQLEERIKVLQSDSLNLTEQNMKIEKQLQTTKNKIDKSKGIYKSVENYINGFYSDQNNLTPLINSEKDFIEELSPSVELKLHCMDIKELRKAFKDNDKQIESVLTQYSSRYTTKANKCIYSLMVIALRAELQNILYALKYEKLDVAVDLVKSTTQKYLEISVQGNQNIAGTISKFIAQIEYLFINAVKIEYHYYVKKEEARQEQLAIREQMKQEAEERKALELEKKKIEAEESKYNNEIEKNRTLLETATDMEKASLNARILELQSQLSELVLKKEEVVKLANGQAGNVYIISNLGSFGENMFKVGMTRRLDPQDRVNELGDASVPFKYDVHSFIFSNDAVALESKLHELLNDKRVNKVNLRKEFFYSSVDELEELVQTIDPTAEFTKTMIAEDFRQSQSL